MRQTEALPNQFGNPDSERLRVLRDIHDGVGPILTGMAFGLRAARNLIGRDQESVARLLGQLEEELCGAIAELRLLTRDAHPDVLDRIGFVEAIRLHAMALSSRVSGARGGTLHIDVRSCGDLSLLTLPVRVAAYRIICEALTNTARHSRARSCVVWIRLDGELHVEVIDDGIGPPCGDGPPGSGMGLWSMRERTIELGGVWTIEPGASGGTRVSARFPLDEV
jgi:signal transduction histidine kinase